MQFTCWFFGCNPFEANKISKQYPNKVGKIIFSFLNGAKFNNNKRLFEALIWLNIIRSIFFGRVNRTRSSDRLVNRKLAKTNNGFFEWHFYWFVYVIHFHCDVTIIDLLRSFRIWMEKKSWVFFSFYSQTILDFIAVVISSNSNPFNFYSTSLFGSVIKSYCSIVLSQPFSAHNNRSKNDAYPPRHYGNITQSSQSPSDYLPF